MIPFSQDLMHYYLTDLGRWARGPVYRVLTTRGCPYRCSYCANNALANIYPDWCKLRRRSPANVIAEIQSARARLPSIEAIVIDDDTFLANPEPYIAEFCQRYGREVGLPFRVYTTAQTADPIKLDLLANAGLRFIVMGIQTGSVRIQKLYQRNVSNDRLLHAARIIHTFQAWAPRPMYDIITDNPYETDDDRFETLQLIHRLPPPYRLSLFSLTFYPGTELYHQAKADGLAQNEIEDIYRRNFLMVEANFYNLALYCHHLNLPRPFLFLITRRVVFDFLSHEPMNRICGRLFQTLMRLRLHTNKRLYSQRQLEWSEQDLARNHGRNSRL